MGVPDMKSNLHCGARLFCSAINIAVDGMFAIGPKFFPGEKFGIVEQQAPEFDEVTVIWTLIGFCGAEELVQFLEAFFGAFEINAAFASGFLVNLAKAGDARGISFAAVARANGIVEGALAFGAPHQAVYLVGLAVIFGEADEEISVIGMQRAESAGPTALPIHFVQFLDAGDIVAENIFEPAIDFHAALMSLGQNVGDDIEIAMVGGFGFFESGVLIKFGVGSCKVAAVEVQIVFLLAMVGEREYDLNFH